MLVENYSSGDAKPRWKRIWLGGRAVLARLGSQEEGLADPGEREGGWGGAGY